MSILIFTMLISMILYMLSTLSHKTFNNKKKLFPFECGFNPFSAPRNPFSLQFFKILLIFLLFDLEIILVLPLPFSQIKLINNNMIIILILFMILMTLYYEWLEGSLKWMK